MHSAAKIGKPNQEWLKQVAAYFSDIMRILEGASRGLIQCHEGPSLLSSYLYYPWHMAFILMVPSWRLHCEVSSLSGPGRRKYRKKKGGEWEGVKSGKQKLLLKLSACLIGQTLSHGHLAVRDSGRSFSWAHGHP